MSGILSATEWVLSPHTKTIYAEDQGEFGENKQISFCTQTVCAGKIWWEMNQETNQVLELNVKLSSG